MLERDAARPVAATQRIVIERMPSLAFLAPGDRTGSVTFEHELFFSAFLARTVAESFSQGASTVRMILSRAVLPSDVSPIAIRLAAASGFLVGGSEGSDVSALLDKISEASAPDGVRAAQVRENGGRIVASALKWACQDGLPLADARLQHIVFPGGDLNGVALRDSVFRSVTFLRTDLRSTTIQSSTAEGTWLQDVTVDPSTTRLELVGIDPARDVFGLRVWRAGQTETVYDPQVVIDTLVACGTISAPLPPVARRSVPERHVRLLERFIRAYARANPVCTSDDRLRTLFSDRDWPFLEELLVRHGVVTAEKRAARGPQKTFLRRQVLPDEIMAGARADARVPDPVRRFWDDLERRG